MVCLSLTYASYNDFLLLSFFSLVSRFICYTFHQYTIVCVSAYALINDPWYMHSSTRCMRVPHQCAPPYARWACFGGLRILAARHFDLRECWISIVVLCFDLQWTGKPILVYNQNIMLTMCDQSQPIDQRVRLPRNKPKKNHTTHTIWSTIDNLTTCTCVCACAVQKR